MRAFFSLLFMSTLMFAVIQTRLFHSTFEDISGYKEEEVEGVKMLLSIDHPDNTFMT